MMDLSEAGKGLPAVGTIATALYGAWSVTNRANQMRHRIERDVQLLEKLPETLPGRTTLAKHIDRSIERMVMSAERAESRTWDIYTLIWMVIFLGLGVGVAAWAVRESYGRWEIAMWAGVILLGMLAVSAFFTSRKEGDESA